LTPRSFDDKLRVILIIPKCMNQTEQKHVFEHILKIVVWLTVILVPVFFLPITLNILDFNKQFLLYGLVTVGVLMWFISAMARRTLIIHKTALDIPLIILLAVVGLSTLFSLDRQESFFGTSSLFNYSFLFHTALTLFYFLFVQSLTSYKLIKQALGGLVVASWLGILFYLIFGTADGLAIGGAVLRFNPVSSLNSIFIITLVPAFLLSLGYLFDKKRSLQKQAPWLLTFVVTGFLILTSGFHSAVVVAIVGLALMLLLAVINAHRVSYIWASIAFGMALLFGLLLFINVPGAVRPGFPPEVALGRSASNNIVTQSLSSGAKSFLLGAGPSTFNQLFSLYRAGNFNTLERFWSLRFEKPMSTAHSILSELGVLGALVLLFIVLLVVSFVIPRFFGKRQHNEEHIEEGDPYLIGTVCAIFLALTVGFFINIYDTVPWFLWWVFLALTVVLVQPRQTFFTSSHHIPLSDTPHYSLTFSFVAVLMVVSLSAFAVHLGTIYAAEVAFSNLARSESEGSFQTNMELLDAAVKKRPQYHTYRTAAARLALGEAKRLSELENPDTQRITQLFGFAVNEARTATTLSPTRVASWQFLALIYLYAQSAEPRANELAVDALEHAIALEPSNPFFYNQIGNAYAFQGNGDKAIESYEKAFALKADFVPAYINMAAWYDKKGDMTQAINVLERGLEVVGNDQNYIANMGQLYARRGQPEDLEKAKTIAEAFLRDDAKNISALMILAMIAEKKGDKQAALQYYNRILQVDQNNGVAAERAEALQTSAVR